MKKAYRIIIAAVAAGAVLGSCVREIEPEEIGSVTAGADTAAVVAGTRVVSVSFDDETKTVLDGLRPKFVNGDKVLVSNCDGTEEGVSKRGQRRECNNQHGP